jgi:hypothetical protein
MDYSIWFIWIVLCAVVTMIVFGAMNYGTSVADVDKLKPKRARRPRASDKASGHAASNGNTATVADVDKLKPMRARRPRASDKSSVHAASNGNTAPDRARLHCDSKRAYRHSTSSRNSYYSYTYSYTNPSTYSYTYSALPKSAVHFAEPLT